MRSRVRNSERLSSALRRSASPTRGASVCGKALRCLSLLGILSFAQACSPTYVLRAGWEEAQILLDREPIEELLEQKDLAIDVRNMLYEVQRARRYSERVGLRPNKSFLYYSQVDRDVLVWVLTAAPRNELRFKTWWFPIVGSVPYKGFFEKEQAVQAMQTLSAQGFDAYIRPSLAFSTLGWFSDPLLSTMRSVDTNALVDTVFHELLHNTIWVPDHVPFNESFANAVGAFVSVDYFRQYYGPEHQFTKEAASRWQDEVSYSVFLASIRKELEQAYEQHKGLAPQAFLKMRKALFVEINERWEQERAGYRSSRYQNFSFQANNAALLAQTIYMTDLVRFDRVYQLSNRDFSVFMKHMRKLAEDVAEDDADPFVLLARLQQDLEGLGSGSTTGR